MRRDGKERRHFGFIPSLLVFRCIILKRGAQSLLRGGPGYCEGGPAYWEVIGREENVAYWGVLAGGGKKWGRRTKKDKRGDRIKKKRENI